MNDHSLELMPISELWEIREKINARLILKIEAEKLELERRLARLGGTPQKVRRPYPKVHPKYRNPSNPLQVWSGRGATPHWFRQQLDAGNRVEALAIHV